MAVRMTLGVARSPEGMDEYPVDDVFRDVIYPKSTCLQTAALDRGGAFNTCLMRSGSSQSRERLVSFLGGETVY